MLIEQAKAEHRNTAKAIIRAVKQRYPIGETLLVKLGGHVLTVQITDHDDCWWVSPGGIYGRNIATGKIRRFYHEDVIG